MVQKNELPGGSKNELREVQKMNPSNNNISNTDINNIISSRRTEKNSDEFSQSAELHLLNKSIILFYK